MTTKQLNYKTLPVIAVTDGATTPALPASDAGAMAYSSTLNKPVTWSGAAWSLDYTHPVNHPASVITQDANNRFVSDAEKTTWNAKIGSVKTINGQSIVGTGDLIVAGSNTFANDIIVSGLTVGRGRHGGHTNTTVGFNSKYNHTGVSHSTAIGHSALFAGNGDYNTAIGSQSSEQSFSSNHNVSIGYYSKQQHAGSECVAVGSGALSNGSGNRNIAVGFGAASVCYGNNNIAIGDAALTANTGNNNIAIGPYALRSNPGSGNIQIGAFSNTGQVLPVFTISGGMDNRVAIGSSSVTNAYIQVAWTVVSDARDKTNFAAIPHGLDFVKRLKPTAYQFRESRESEATNGGVRYGFKAQDIAAIEPESVIVDTTNPEKLYYNESNLIPVLVQAMQELVATTTAKNTALEARIAVLEGLLAK